MPADEALRRVVATAAERLEAAIRVDLPSMGSLTSRWLGSLTATGRLADYFTHASRFPMLALPWWAAGPEAAEDFDFHVDVAASTMAGYCYIRVIDDLVDRQPGATVDLLPITALLHTEFQSPYLRRFPLDSAFWPLFRSAWMASADAMVAPVSSAASPEALLERATSTIGAVIIPLRAVTLMSGRPDRFEAWRVVVAELARIEQLIDDVVDWHADFERDLPNLLLAEAARRARAGEAAPAWVVREGYIWGLRAAKERIDAMAGPAAELGSPSLNEFLAARREAVTALEQQTMKGLSEFAALAEIFGRPPS